MLFALSVSQVAALIGVECEAKPTLVCADMIPHEVWILGDIYGLKNKSSESLLALDIGILVAGNPHTSYPGSWPVLPIDHYIRGSNDYESMI
jgi:hypothetical protein